MSEQFTLTTAPARGVHPFEKRGLGKAPFRYVGIIDQNISYGQAVIGHVGGIPLTTNPGGTCDYCGTAIVVMFGIISADGIRSHVGCDCIERVDEVAPIKNMDKLAQDRKRLKATREKGRIAKAIAALPTATALDSIPHPLAWRAAQGDTMRQWCEWMFANAGTAGKLKAARVVEDAIANRSASLPL
jgi:hypothetical protein